MFPIAVAPERATPRGSRTAKPCVSQRQRSCGGPGLVAQAPCWSSEAWTGTRSHPAYVHQTSMPWGNQPPKGHVKKPSPHQSSVLAAGLHTGPRRALAVRHNQRGHRTSEGTRIRLSAQGPKGTCRVFTSKFDVKLTSPGTHATAAARFTHSAEVGARHKEQAGRLNPPLSKLAEVKHSEIRCMR